MSHVGCIVVCRVWGAGRPRARLLRRRRRRVRAPRLPLGRRRRRRRRRAPPLRRRGGPSRSPPVAPSHDPPPNKTKQRRRRRRAPRRRGADRARSPPRRGPREAEVSRHTDGISRRRAPNAGGSLQASRTPAKRRARGSKRRRPGRHDGSHLRERLLRGKSRKRVAAAPPKWVERRTDMGGTAVRNGGSTWAGRPPACRAIARRSGCCSCLVPVLFAFVVLLSLRCSCVVPALFRRNCLALTDQQLNRPICLGDDYEFCSWSFKKRPTPCLWQASKIGNWP